jgi:Na(+)-translocating NADH:ubiquinone oxidoreductase F subunit
LGIQVLIWVVTGSLISLIDTPTAGGRLTRQAPTEKAPLARYLPVVPIALLPIATNTLRSVQLDSLFSKPVYRVISTESRALFDAQTGRALVIDKPLAERIARSSYRGEGLLLDSEKLAQGSDEMRDASGALWRINFGDPLATRVYISAEDGRVLAHRNNRWQLVDFLLMLHFMDYVRADNFNNPQIIVFGFGTFWLAMSGLLLVFYSFTRNDFRWLPGAASSGTEVTILAGAKGQMQEEISLDSSLSFLAGLSHKNIHLPSNCDGSGSCGLCKIFYKQQAPDPTASDREWIGKTGLACGERLACRHRPRAGDSIVVPEIALLDSVLWGEIVTSRWLTPLLKEIRIHPDDAIEFRPGEYFQLQVPVCDIRRDQLDIPAEFKPVWDTMSLPHEWHCTKPHFRAYSVATAPGQEDCLAFTVRFMPPPADAELPPGIGSSYLCSLRPGDRIAFRESAGDFQLVDSNREKILIGGGAGMAPLKSMALHLLKNDGWEGKLRFWYGARNQQEILYRDTFEALAQEHQNFEWGVALSDAEEDETWQGERGFIHQVVCDHVLGEHDNPMDCEFYLCGPPLMLAATLDMLRGLGVPDELIRFDDFGS